MDKQLILCRERHKHSWSLVWFDWASTIFLQEVWWDLLTGQMWWVFSVYHSFLSKLIHNLVYRRSARHNKLWPLKTVLLLPTCSQTPEDFTSPSEENMKPRRTEPLSSWTWSLTSWRKTCDQVQVVKQWPDGFESDTRTSLNNQLSLTQSQFNRNRQLHFL